VAVRAGYPDPGALHVCCPDPGSLYACYPDPGSLHACYPDPGALYAGMPIAAAPPRATTRATWSTKLAH